MIVQNSMYPIVITKLSTMFDLATNKHNYFNFEAVSSFFFTEILANYFYSD